MFRGIVLCCSIVSKVVKYKVGVKNEVSVCCAEVIAM
jgi:hypothetical protein